MKRKKYKKIIKLLDLALNMLRSEKPNYKWREYSNVKAEILRVIEQLEANTKWWIDEN